jgi:hypothetical protein
MISIVEEIQSRLPKEQQSGVVEMDRTLPLNRMSLGQNQSVVSIRIWEIGEIQENGSNR